MDDTLRNMPGFTAEASLYNSTERYVARETSGSGEMAIQPAISWSLSRCERCLIRCVSSIDSGSLERCVLLCRGFCGGWPQ